MKYSVLPWAKRLEESIFKYLYSVKEREMYYPEYLLAGLERGDIASRYAAYGTGRQNGWLSANDIRRLENMDPIDGGDVYLVPLNMVPADQVRAGARGLLLEGGHGETRTYDLTDVSSIENRALRSTTARYRLAGAFQKVLLDAAERAMKRETRDVGAAVKKYMGMRDHGQFLMWLDEFYLEHTEFMTRQFFPIFLAYAESIAAEAQDEIAADLDLKDRLERFVKSYSGSFAAAQAGISLYRLRKALQDALDNGEDAEAALHGELEHWQDVRPSEIASEHSTRAGGAVAKIIYTAAGILTLTWVTVGDTCPLCKGMDGRSISINKTFLAPGEEFKPEGAATALTTTTHIAHPPLHDGCDCMIRAG